MAERVTEQMLAERYHETHFAELDHDHSSCWCCCITCEHVNPHYENAIAELARGADD